MYVPPIQAALLHDTVEDTDTSIAELELTFGPTVARIVQEVTDDKTLPKQERKRLQVEHAPHCSQQAKLVKLADKLYNLRDLNRCTPTGGFLFCGPLCLAANLCFFITTCDCAVSSIHVSVFLTIHLLVFLDQLNHYV